MVCLQAQWRPGRGMSCLAAPGLTDWGANLKLSFRSWVSVRACVRACFRAHVPLFVLPFSRSCVVFVLAFVLAFLGSWVFSSFRSSFTCFRSLVHAWFSCLLSFFRSLVHECFLVSFPFTVRAFVLLPSLPSSVALSTRLARVLTICKTRRVTHLQRNLQEARHNEGRQLLDEGQLLIIWKCVQLS